MVIGLSIACGVLGCLAITFLFLFLLARKDIAHLRNELKRFGQIADVEQYVADQRALADAAKGELSEAKAQREQTEKEIVERQEEIANQKAQIEEHAQQLAASAEKLGAYQDLAGLLEQIEKQKQQVKQYNQVLGSFKNAQELAAHIKRLESRVQELKGTIGAFQTLAQIQSQISAKQSQVAGLEARANELDQVLAGARTATDLHNRIVYQQNLLAELQAQQQQVEETLAMQEFGFYHAHYDFESASDYQRMLDTTRARQKEMVKQNRAILWDKQWVVEGSDAKGRKMMAEQTKLMLRAFNGECDGAIAKVKYNNATNLENRINRSCEQINKLGKTNCAAITADYLALKRQELYLVHEHRVKKQEEKEEQQRIKEQMREEEKAQKEIEKAQKEAEKEEHAKERALTQARLELERATKSQRAATKETEMQNQVLAQQVAKLEAELKDAIDRKAKAIARAQLTRSGHVYVLSNIGSFGENVYKIGMTRRLEPLERVKELGDASVPFKFDVHAMIYSEDAPDLEAKLHRHFAHRRVNLVNLRREYFYAQLEEIMEAVKEHYGLITYVKVPEAPEYRETLAQRREDQSPDRLPPALLQRAVGAAV